MSPYAGMLLVNEILPRLRAAIPRAVRPVGAEDHAELIQDAAAIASAALHSAEARGIALMPASIAFYAIQTLRAGRRSGYAGRTDALCPAAQLDGMVTVASLDAPLEGADEDGDDPSLHDLLADRGEDAAMAAGRRIDWDAAMLRLNDRQRAVLLATAEGRGPGEIATQFHVSAPRVCQIRETLGTYITDAWGCNGLNDVSTQPTWMAGMRAAQERRVGRHERAAA